MTWHVSYHPVARAAAACPLNEGDIAVVLGINGAGKSSLLCALAGVPTVPGSVAQIKNDEGVPLVLGAAQCAFLPQRHGLQFPVPVQDVLDMAWSGQMSAAAFRSHSETVVAALDLGPLLTRPYTRLSGGEQQRVQLARVCCQLGPAQWRGGLLLLDEPFNALDIAYVGAVVGWLQQCAAQGLRIMVAMHDLQWLDRLASRVLLLGENDVLALPFDQLSADDLTHIYGVPVDAHKVEERTVFLPRC